MFFVSLIRADVNSLVTYISNSNPDRKMIKYGAKTYGSAKKYVSAKKTYITE